MPKKTFDYQKLGLKCGLEIHQQLDTKKLFCNCPSLLRKDEPDFEIKRKLHAVAGESGEIDEAVAYQSSLNKEFVYQGYNTTCLIELDEEPPHEINKEALEIALQISILLHAKIIPLTQIMRKTVIDGSNTSGFQRTVLIAKDGYIETEKGRVKIEGICLEEDAARIVEIKKDKAIYRLDRLGIPLVEVTTSPDIKSPFQAKEVAFYIGNVLRSCKVKRGLGTIRQDVNVSIEKGKRIEIKGVQSLDLIAKTVEQEIKRQQELVEENKKFKSEVRKALPDGKTEFLRPLPGSARMYPETDLPMLKISRKMMDESKKSLPKLRGDVEEELKNKGLNKEMIKLIFKQNKLEEFKELLEIVENPNLVAKTLLVFPKEINNKIKVRKKLDKDILAFILEKYKKGKINEGQIKESLERIVKGVKISDAVKFQKTDMRDVEEKIMKIIKEKPGLSEKAYMGLVMKEFKGKISGREAMEIIKKLMK